VDDWRVEVRVCKASLRGISEHAWIAQPHDGLEHIRSRS